MPRYNACGASVRLSVAKLSDTLSDNAMFNKGSEARTRIEKAREAFEASQMLTEENIPFPGDDSGFSVNFIGKYGNTPFLMVQAGADLFKASSNQEMPAKRTSDRSQARRSSTSTQASSSNTPHQLNEEHIQSASPITQSNTFGSMPPPQSLGLNRLCLSSRPVEQVQPEMIPHALALHVILSDRTFQQAAHSESDMNVKIDVFFNGTLANSTYISPRDVNSKVPVKPFHQIFSGTRVAWIVERPWVMLPPMQNADGSLRGLKRSIGAVQRWNELSAALLREADIRGFNRKRERAPSGDYLESLAQMSMPEQVTAMQKPGGRKFGVIDVILTSGKGGKITGSGPYMKEPTRLIDNNYKLNVNDATSGQLQDNLNKDVLHRYAAPRRQTNSISPYKISIPTEMPPLTPQYDNGGSVSHSTHGIRTPAMFTETNNFNGYMDPDEYSTMESTFPVMPPPSSPFFPLPQKAVPGSQRGSFFPRSNYSSKKRKTSKGSDTGSAPMFGITSRGLYTKPGSPTDISSYELDQYGRVQFDFVPTKPPNIMVKRLVITSGDVNVVSKTLSAPRLLMAKNPATASRSETSESEMESVFTFGQRNNVPREPNTPWNTSPAPSTRATRARRVSYLSTDEHASVSTGRSHRRNADTDHISEIELPFIEDPEVLLRRLRPLRTSKRNFGPPPPPRGGFDGAGDTTCSSLSPALSAISQPMDLDTEMDIDTPMEPAIPPRQNAFQTDIGTPTQDAWEPQPFDNELTRDQEMETEGLFLDGASDHTAPPPTPITLPIRPPNRASEYVGPSPTPSIPTPSKSRSRAKSTKPRIRKPQGHELNELKDPGLSEDCVITFAQNGSWNMAQPGAKDVLRQIKSERPGHFLEEEVLFGVRFFVGG